MYNVNYFIKKFEAIPEGRWTKGDYIDEEGCMCALGHCGYRGSDSHIFRISDEGAALNSLLKYRTPGINDGSDERYDQPTPKQRILAALKDVANEKY
jgi:hypothetical protein